MLVAMEQVSRADDLSANANRSPEVNQVYVGMRHGWAGGEDKEAQRLHLIQVSCAAVGYSTYKPQCPVDVCVHFTPEGAPAGRVVEILYHGYPGGMRRRARRPVLAALERAASLGRQVGRDHGRKSISYHRSQRREKAAHLRAQVTRVPRPYFEHLDRIRNRGRIDLPKRSQLLSI